MRKCIVSQIAEWDSHLRWTGSSHSPHPPSAALCHFPSQHYVDSLNPRSARRWSHTLLIFQLNYRLTDPDKNTKIQKKTRSHTKQSRSSEKKKLGLVVCVVLNLTLKKNKVIYFSEVNAAFKVLLNHSEEISGHHYKRMSPFAQQGAAYSPQ